MGKFELHVTDLFCEYRQLEDELQAEKTQWQSERDELMQEIERLKEDNDRQQKLLSVNLTKSPQTQTEAFMQHEITRLTSENLVSTEL
jgi:myosin-5